MGRKKLDRERNGYTPNHNRSNWAGGRARTELRSRHLAEYWRLVEEGYRQVDVSAGESREEQNRLRNRVYNLARAQLTVKHRDEYELIKDEQYRVYDDLKRQGDI